MQNIENTSTARRRLLWISIGALVVLAIGGGVWFSTQEAPKPKKMQQMPMASMADMPAMSPDSPDATTDASTLQVDLGPDDLKKA
jgi:hypothetical protein